ncbi:MAG TPA: PIG-L deacetylase family protein [Gaiellaceae bacterium]|nr:PIG-L deacetylase family protein [Gaiellaceae bacterium]
MLTLDLAAGRERLAVLAVGAHADDIELGCGGTLLHLARAVPELDLTWVVLSAAGSRRDEAEAGARALGATTVEIRDFEDAFFSYGRDVKDYFETLKRFEPDVVLTHTDNDRHQDHRLVCELTWNTFRDHLILEYEIPKYDGDLGSPTVFVPLDESIAAAKIEALLRSFPSQASKPWFDESLFRALLRLRGMECRSPSGLAEAFYARKLVL